MREGIMTEMSRREASAEHTPHAFQSGRPKSVGKFMPGQKFANFLTGHKSPAEREMYFLVFHFCSFLVCALSAFLTFNITNFALLAVLRDVRPHWKRGKRRGIMTFLYIYTSHAFCRSSSRGETANDYNKVSLLNLAECVLTRLDAAGAELWVRQLKLDELCPHRKICLFTGQRSKVVSVLFALAILCECTSLYFLSDHTSSIIPEYFLFITSTQLILLP